MVLAFALKVHRVDLDITVSLRYQSPSGGRLLQMDPCSCISMIVVVGHFMEHQKPSATLCLMAVGKEFLRDLHMPKTEAF